MLDYRDILLIHANRTEYACRHVVVGWLAAHVCVDLYVVLFRMYHHTDTDLSKCLLGLGVNVVVLCNCSYLSEKWVQCSCVSLACFCIFSVVIWRENIKWRKEYSVPACLHQWKPFHFWMSVCRCNNNKWIERNKRVRSGGYLMSHVVFSFRFIFLSSLFGMGNSNKVTIR